MPSGFSSACSASALAVGAVAEADRAPSVVEPEVVAAVGVGVALERAEHRDVEPLELASAAWPGSRMRAGLAMFSGMPPRAAHDQRVVHVDRVDLALERVRDLDLHAEPVEQLDEGRVLALERRRVGRPPARAVPVAGGRGPPDQDPLQRRDHGRDAVAGAGRADAVIRMCL